MSDQQAHDFAEFRVFLGELFAEDPRLGACRGASEADIGALTALAERPLPPLYLDYLRFLGADDGPLQLGDDCKCSAASVLAYVARRKGKIDATKPPRAFRISNDALSYARSLLYRDDASDPEVVMNDLTEVVEVLAEDFTVFLFRQAWFKRWFGGRSTGMPSLRGKGVSSLADVARVADEQGFRPMWFSGRWMFCAEKGAVRVITRFDAGDLFVFFAGPDLWTAASECDGFRRALGYRDQ